jgi:ketosteroid isomerase-like protein
MSGSNVELHRRTVEAFNAHDVEALIALLDADVEFHSAMTTPGGADYRGHDGARRWLGDLRDAWGDEFRIEPEAYFDLGAHTLCFQVLHGRGRQSGAEVTLSTAAVVRWRDGLTVHFRTYAHREDALSDLSISEDDLEPIDP